jgi:hypothetical protein
MRRFGIRAGPGVADDRRDEPPYFAAHSYATAAIWFHARGQQVEADRLTDLLLGLPNTGARSTRPCCAPRAPRRPRGRGPLRKPDGWAVHRGDALESESELTAARAAWPEAAAFATEMRAQAEENGTVIVSAFADRLEGRAASPSGDAGRAQELPRGRPNGSTSSGGLGTGADRCRPGAACAHSGRAKGERPTLGLGRPSRSSAP